MTYAEIESGVEVNIIVIDPEHVPDWCADWPDVATAKIGDTYADGEFVTPLAEAE